MSTPRLLFELRDAAVWGPRGQVLGCLDLQLHDHTVTVLLGPAGTGKSALLRGLAGRLPADGWRYAGSWRYCGLDLAPDSIEAAPIEEIAWVPQPRRPRLPGATASGIEPDWARAFDRGARTVLMDEPTRGCSDAATGWLAARLRSHAKTGSAVVVTHDLAFARSVADWAIMVCAGSLVASMPAPGFFGHPPNDLAARFVEQGNCWPPPRPPELPPHFHWILDGRLAGMGRPGLNRDEELDLEAIAAAGIEILVSLTEQPYPAERLRAFGIEARHLPIRDMGVPAIGPAASLCRSVERALDAGRSVAMHCHAGMGRTGTLLAAVLVWLGRPADRAVADVRAVNRGFIQNRTQLQFVRRFAETVGPASARQRSLT